MKLFMPELNAQERISLMQQNAEQVEETTYLKPLSPDELDAKREEFTDNATRLSELEDEKKDVMAEFKYKMDPLTKVNKLLMQDIKTKQTSVTGTLYHIANHEENMMETYDENGYLVSSRRLRPNERRNIFSLSKAQ